MQVVAFLRAVNVGGRIMPMERLRVIVERLGFTKVETFIASGNLIFEAPAAKARAAEAAIEKALRAAFGYDVMTFLRTREELAAAASLDPFDIGRRASAKTFNVGFVKAPVEAAIVAKLAACSSDVNDVHVHGREVYWLSQMSQSDPKLPKIPFERLLGGPITFRGMKTLQKMTAKYPPG